MPKAIKIGERWVGEDYSTFIIGEIGINHNGDLSIAKRLIDVAVMAGCNAVKFQKRTPEKSVPPEYQNVKRETPWGFMTYLEYRHKVEFGYEEYAEIDRYAKEKGILWFASCWDEDSVDFIEQFTPPCYKVASASLTDDPLLKKIKSTKRPIILSTGMSTLEEIEAAINLLSTDNLLIAHSTSTYPCPPEELNLRMIQTLQNRYDCPVGYSGHEVGLQATFAAVTLGADFIERHITLDRAMWGSDQAASVEPWGLMRLVRDIRVIENALGDGQKRVYPSELKARQKLRRNNSLS
ncbi:MAG: N-acetylneuraminate synthase family protein [Anaerolineales bacterium]|nr:N-acetylneuraminate synthase family protein [Anaerolineales bacterium]MCK4975820.1 N-acetylneuraminate synthase family protein [Anaerolineales bacterium]